MKKPLLLFCLMLVGAFYASAITNTWTGAGVVKKWDNDTNWSLSHKPLVTEDVVIPTGYTVDAIGFYCYMKTFTLQGTSVLNLEENFQVTDTALIASSATLNWTSGEFNGGGKMRNKGTINILNSIWFCVVQGNNVINNEGTINLPIVSGTSTSNFMIQNGIINNLSTGIIDIKGDGSSLSVSTGSLHNVNNWGIIKKTGGTGITDLSINFHNFPAGKVEVNSGTLNFVNYNDTLESGTYNVSTGCKLGMASTTQYSGTLAGTLKGPFKITGHLQVPTTATFDFSGTASVHWSGGYMVYGGTLTNNSKMIIDPVSYVWLQDGNKLVNTDSIQLMGSLGIRTGSIITNQYGGVFEFPNNNGFMSSGSSFLNHGLLLKSGGNGTNNSDISFHNFSDGTVRIDSGAIQFNNYIDTIEGGTFNVATGAKFIMNAETYYSGSLKGLLNGEYVLEGGSIRFPTTASFDFTGSGHVRWNSGGMFNSGTLTNNSKMLIQPQCWNCATINWGTMLNNNGTIEIKNNSLGLAGVVNNYSSGVININDDAGFFSAGASVPYHVLNNYGLISKASGAGNSFIDLDSITNMGTIECNSGTIKINSSGANHFINRSSGIIKGIAAFEFPGSQYASNKYTNNGITSPGGNIIDTLWINNNSYYYTSDSSVLDIQINGTTQGVTYDYLNITNGNANFAGKVKVTLGYAPVLGDTFIVATCSGSTLGCTIDSTAKADFGAYGYHFKVECVRNNALKLSVKGITTGIQNIDLENGISVYPNPSSDFVSIKNNSKLAIKSIQIMNTMGQVVKTVDADNNMISISLQELAAGNYFIKINSADSYCIKSIIKK